MNIHEQYMHRCLALASLGAGHVAPNPMVGAVLVYENRIIGEGYHEHYGEAHAEVNCIENVRKEDEQFISKSTLYVSLEPCAHYGKTPPCADLIISRHILKVVIGCRDPFKEVNGKGIEKLQSAGIDITVNVLEAQCKQINKRFFTFHEKQRPNIILKWAQSKNGKIAGKDFQRMLISNDISNRMVHKCRSEEAAIMVGTNTAFHDNPALNTRLWNGPNPVRIIVDIYLRLPLSLKIFDRQQPTIIFNGSKSEKDGNLHYIRLDKNQSIVAQVLDKCFELRIISILIEGGTKLLQSFIDSNLWDEAIVIQNRDLIIEPGLEAPTLSNEHLSKTEQLISDSVTHYRNSGIF